MLAKLGALALYATAASALLGLDCGGSNFDIGATISLSVTGGSGDNGNYDFCLLNSAGNIVDELLSDVGVVVDDVLSIVLPEDVGEGNGYSICCYNTGDHSTPVATSQLFDIL